MSTMRFMVWRKIPRIFRCLTAFLLPLLPLSLLLTGAALGQTVAGKAEPATTTTVPSAPTLTNSTDIVRESQAWVSQNHLLLWISYLAVASAVATLMYRFSKTEAWANLRQRLQNEVLSNWRLALLGITSIALTLASGWTTWDGMTNFTGTPLLSFLITFGIQGIMLIAAWLIGESFAVGLAGPGNGGKLSTPDRILAVLSVVLLAAALYAIAMVAMQRGTIDYLDSIIRRHKSELQLDLPTSNFRILIALGFSALFTLLLVSQKEIFQPYTRGLKAIFMSLPVWLMFLACAITSVFFSFDSLFSTIFPQDQRARVAQLRTTNQVAGIVADLGVTISKRQGDSIDGLFSGAEWKDYSSRITDIITIARAAPDQIAALTRKELEDQQSVRAGLEERKATAQSQQVRLEQRKEVLLADVNKLKEEVPPIAAEVDRLKGDVFKKDSEILAKKAEMQAEAGGVGGTLKAGQGPEFQKRRKELDDFAKLKAIVESQLKERAAQLKGKRDSLASSEGELAQIDGEIGKLRGEKDVADKQMASVSAPKPVGSLAATTETMATTGFSSLDDAFAQFRQHPDRKSFDAVQQQCGALLTVFDKVPALKTAAGEKAVRCDPSVVAEQVSRILALNDGLVAFKDRCSKPDSLPQTSVDDLLTFGQQCVQSSGLDSKDTALYRGNINSIGLNRDDKAHRFVVSWNAFLDGNRLAYLALAIAIALDGLVFMSGLFGANATSSPLVRLPGAAGRSPGELEVVMYNSLGADVYGTAQIILNALHPIVPHDGFVSEIRTGDYHGDTAATIRRVLSAGGQFGAVEPDGRTNGVFLVRGELTQFLAKACDRELRTKPAVVAAAERARELEVARHAEFEKQRQVDAEALRQSEVDLHKGERELQRRARALEPVLTAALIPDDLDDKESLFHTSQRLLAQMRPTANHAEFTSEIELTNLRSADQQFFRGILNTAAARRAVEKADAGERELYMVRPELILCLTAIRVKAYDDWQRRARKQGMFGWLLGPRDVTPQKAALAAKRPSLQIVAQPAKEATTATPNGASSESLPPRLPASQPAPVRSHAEAPKPRREAAVPAVLNGKAPAAADAEPLMLERIVAWGKRNAFSDVEMSWLKVLLRSDRRSIVTGYLAEILAPAMVADAEQDARAELSSFRTTLVPDGLGDAEADNLQRALSALHQLQSLKEQLSTTLDRHIGDHSLSAEQQQYFHALGELSDAIRLFSHDTDKALDSWQRAAATMRLLDGENARQRLAN